MLRPGLVVPPRFSHESLFETRKATWLELFYDLVFVVAISQCSTALHNQFDPDGIRRFALVFVAIWWAWVGQTFYLTRFDSDDVVHRIVTAIQMFAVAVLAVSIPDALGTKSALFIFSYVAIRCVLVFEYVRVGQYIPQARPLTNGYIGGFSVAIAIWVFSLTLPGHLKPVAWVTALIIDFVTPFLLRDKVTKLPPHSAHIPERFGLFTIIVLGESVLSVVSGMQASAISPYVAGAGALGWLFAFTIWWGYFDGVRAAEEQQLLTPERTNRFRVWMYAHLPLTMGIIVASVGVKHVVDLKHWAPLDAYQGFALVVATFCIMALLNILFLMSPNVKDKPAIQRFLIPHWVVAVSLLALLPITPRLPGITLLGILTGVSTLQVVLSLRRMPTSGTAG